MPLKKSARTGAARPYPAISGKSAEAGGFAEKLGFQVAQLRLPSPEHALQILLERVLSDYPLARSEGAFGSTHPLWGTFNTLSEAIEQLPAVKARATLKVEWSMGKGNWARVPWLAIIDSREDDAPTGGMYCVFLFRADMSGVYITLNQGVTRPREEVGAADARKYLRAQAAKIRGLASDLQNRQFALDDDIDLRSTGLGGTYEESAIAYKVLWKGSDPIGRRDRVGRQRDPYRLRAVLGIHCNSQENLDLPGKPETL